MESFFSLLQKKILDRQRWLTRWDWPTCSCANRSGYPYSIRWGDIGVSEAVQGQVLVQTDFVPQHHRTCCRCVGWRSGSGRSVIQRASEPFG